MTIKPRIQSIIQLDDSSVKELIEKIFTKLILCTKKNSFKNKALNHDKVKNEDLCQRPNFVYCFMTKIINSTENSF